MSDVLVVGAGQLGLMMASAGARFGVSVDRIDHVSGELVPGTSRLRLSMPSSASLAGYKAITAELEHLLGNPLVENLAALPNWRNGDAMQLLPARDQQKRMLDTLGIATAPWRELKNRRDLTTAGEALGGSLVVKTVRDGYDGKGQWRLEPNDLPDDESNGESNDDSSDERVIPDAVFGQAIAEQMIPFRRELSLIGARFADGKTVFYPLVENYHQQGMLRYTVAPASRPGDLQGTAESMLGSIMHHLDYVGVMAMECFDSEQGLLVNELAPRVHNSGHWSQLGANYSQFDLHLFALCDHPVRAPVDIAHCSLMLNLIGCEWNPSWRSAPGLQCWWYGKSWRENRKLGHINISGASVHEVVEVCESLIPTLDAFHREMLGLAIARLGALNR